MSDTAALDELGIWSDLTEAERSEIKSVMRMRRIARGERLIEQGSTSETLFIVNFGLFEVRRAGDAETVAKIGVGQPIGEIGFFSGERRTASVFAARDSEVLELDKTTFDALVQRHSKIQSALTRSMAKRLAEMARHQTKTIRMGRMRTVAVIGGGSGGIPPSFDAGLRRSMSIRDRTCVLASSDAKAHFGGGRLDGFDLANWLAVVERENDLVVCIADDALTDWTQAAIRSADQLVVIAEGAGAGLNRVETFAFELLPATRRRLVRLHRSRSGVADGAEPWTRHRDVFMVHHVALEDDEDFLSLRRFLAGEAIGFVAGGGGAFGPAHVGVYKAFRERGFVFDICGGSSVGSGMAAAFSLLMEPEAIEAAVHDIFVKSKAFKRFILPKYAFLDHTALDRALQRLYGSTLIENVWKPYFAVTTDLSESALRVIRTGLLWRAVRASSSIPGVLPPVFDEEGHMLVDGAIADNVPLAVMKSLKAGPNVVVHICPTDRCLFDVDYGFHPGSIGSLGTIDQPVFAAGIAPLPSPANVIQRSIFADIRRDRQPSGPHDLLLHPPPFPGLSFMNWDRHHDVFNAAYRWGLEALDRLKSDNNPAIVEMERALTGCQGQEKRI